MHPNLHKTLLYLCALENDNQQLTLKNLQELQKAGHIKINPHMVDPKGLHQFDRPTGLKEQQSGGRKKKGN